LTATKITKNLSKALSPISGTEDAEAAVALILKPTNESFDVLLVKRVESPGDPWSGQIALPGGKRELGDKNLRHTVTRETLEETNINLEDHNRFLGTISIQRSTPRPEMRILPFVVLLEHEPKIKLNKKELEASAWISLRKLATHRETARLDQGDAPAYIVDHHVIWGLTYRIIEELLHKLGQQRKPERRLSQRKPFKRKPRSR
jgi:8-oxo-dGTP diphosphatase